MRLTVVILPAFLAATMSLAMADDIFLIDGRTTQGEVVQETIKEVRYKIAGSVQTIPSDQVDRIDYTEKPAAWALAEGARKEGKYEEAVRYYETCTNSAGIMAWVKPYATYNIAMTHLEWGAKDRGALDKAVDAFDRFEKENKQHRLLPAALYGLGDTARLLGRMDRAVQVFDRLAAGEFGNVWALKGRVGKGYIAITQNRPDEAASLFDQVISEGRANPAMADSVALAKAGKGQALVAAKRTSEAIGILEDLVGQPGLPNAAYSAAYRALGDAYRQGGTDKESLTKALYAYLRVVLIYSGPGQDGEKARRGAAECFRALGQDERAREIEGS